MSQFHQLASDDRSLAVIGYEHRLQSGGGPFATGDGFRRRRPCGIDHALRMEVVQGNFVSREQVDALRPGMTRQQVKEVLGTPLLTSVFHADRWDYVFTLKRQGVEPQARDLTVFFKGSAMERFEGDTMPSEAEFVATLDKSTGKRRMPVLEATEAQLGRFQGAPAAAATPAPAEPPPLANYPPLESPAR